MSLVMTMFVKMAMIAGDDNVCDSDEDISDL